MTLDVSVLGCSEPQWIGKGQTQVDRRKIEKRCAKVEDEDQRKDYRGRGGKMKKKVGGSSSLTDVSREERTISEDDRNEQTEFPYQPCRFLYPFHIIQYGKE